MAGLRIEVQPPSVVRLNRTLRPQMVVSLPGDLACDFVTCTIETASGQPVGDILVGGTNANSPESVARPSQSGSSTASRRGRQYSIFYGLSITEVGRFRLKVHATVASTEAGVYVAQATSEEVEVIDGKVAKTKLGTYGRLSSFVHTPLPPTPF